MNEQAAAAANLCKSHCFALQGACKGPAGDCRGPAYPGTAGSLQGTCRGPAGDCNEGPAGGLQGDAGEPPRTSWDLLGRYGGPGGDHFYYFFRFVFF